MILESVFYLVVKVLVCVVKLVGCLSVLEFNATLTAKFISWRSVTQMCFLAFSHQYLHNFSFQSHRLLFSHALAEVRGENTPERKFASTGSRTHNHQAMCPVLSPLNHPGGALCVNDQTRTPAMYKIVKISPIMIFLLLFFNVKKGPVPW